MCFGESGLFTLFRLGRWTVLPALPFAQAWQRLVPISASCCSGLCSCGWCATSASPSFNPLNVLPGDPLLDIVADPCCPLAIPALPAGSGFGRRVFGRLRTLKQQPVFFGNPAAWSLFAVSVRRGKGARDIRPCPRRVAGSSCLEASGTDGGNGARRRLR